MVSRYSIRRDATGFTVADNFTGEPLVLAMNPQTGLSEDDAEHLATLFNTRAEQGDGAIAERPARNLDGSGRRRRPVGG